MNQPTFQEFQDWKCPEDNCGAPAVGYKMDAETAREGVTHADKFAAAHGLPPARFHEFVVSRHYTFVCSKGHEVYIGEYFAKD
jgi:hypothetical protein